MAEPFLAEIRLFSFQFAPRGWAMCNGQTLPINQNTALFSLLGTMYGGNGTTNFQLPNAQGSVLAHAGNTFIQGERTGEASHTLNINEIPAHSHTVSAGGSGTFETPTGHALSTPAVNQRLANIYSLTENSVASGGMIGSDGGSQPHENRQPFLVLNYCIALQGIFPSRN